MSQQEPKNTLQEALAALLAEGKQNGKLPSKKLLDTLDAYETDTDALERFYDEIEAAGVEITVDDILDAFTPEGKKNR